MRLYPKPEPRQEFFRDVMTAFFSVLAAIFLVALFALFQRAEAGLVREAGWQVFIHYAVPVGDRDWTTIGPPLPEKGLCEAVRVEIMIARIKDRVVCRWVDELWVR